MNKINQLAIFSAVILASHSVWAGGFQLNEHSASGLGRAFAGEAAIVDNASAGNRNPASMSRFERPAFSVGAIFITPYIDISGESPRGDDLRAKNIAPNALVPNLHLVYPLNDRWALGGSITSNYGLATDFSRTYPAGSLAGTTELMSGNVNFSGAYRLNSNFSVGLGLNAVYAKAKVIRYAGDAAFPPILGMTPSSEIAHLKGDQWGYGWNAGMLYEFNANHRLGLTYRSKVNIDFKGSFRNDLPILTPPPSVGTGGKFIDGNLTLNLPDIWEFSGYHKVAPKWAMHYSVTYIGWNKFKQLSAESSDGKPLFAKQEDFSNSYRLALGTTYDYDANWTFRTGIAYDKQASHNQPSISIPDQDRYWFSAGSTYRFDRNMSVDLGFTYMQGRSVSFKEESAIPAPNAPVYDFHASGKALLYGINFNYQF